MQVLLLDLDPIYNLIKASAKVIAIGESGRAALGSQPLLKMRGKCPKTPAKELEKGLSESEP